jgi:hypothetical protein
VVNVVFRPYVRALRGSTAERARAVARGREAVLPRNALARGRNTTHYPDDSTPGIVGMMHLRQRALTWDARHRAL